MNALTQAQQQMLREALDQYVANHGEYVEAGEGVTAIDRANLAAAQAMLDDLDAAFLDRVTG